MTIFFTSDLHFGHKNIISYTRRGEVKPNDISQDKWLVDIWKKQVKQNDTVYHLGDFSFHGWKKSVEILTELPGEKVMIRGNHDGEKSWKLYKDIKNVRCYDYKEISHEKVKIVLFHFPIEIWHSQHKGSWHLHGHSHGNFVRPEGFLLDVGIDSAYNILGDHRLFTIQDVCDYMKTRTPSKKKDHHGDDIDDRIGFLRASIATAERILLDIPNENCIDILSMTNHIQNMRKELWELESQNK